MLVGLSQRRLLVSVPSKPMRSRPLELPWLPSTLLPVPAPRPRVMLKRRIAGCGWRESAGLARPLFLTVLPVRVSDPGVTLLGLDRLMPYVPAPSMVLPVMTTVRLLMPETTMPSEELFGSVAFEMVTPVTVRLWLEKLIPCEPKFVIAPPLIETGVLPAWIPSPLALVMVTLLSSRPKLVEPTVLVAPLKMEKAVCGNWTVVPVRAPLPRGVVVKSWVKLGLPQSPATGLPPVASADGQATRPTALSRIVVIVAPPALASRVAPWNVSVLSVFTTAFAGSVRVAPDAIGSPLTTTSAKSRSRVLFVGVIQEALLVRVNGLTIASGEIGRPHV